MSVPIQQSGTAALTAPAPADGNISREHEFSHIYFATMEILSFKGTLEFLLSDLIKGAGQVDLVSIKLNFVLPNAMDAIKAGVCESGNNLTVDQVALKSNGVYMVATEFNAGHKHVAEIIPEDILSKQIRPISSNLPMIQLMVTKTEKAVVNIEVKVKVRGFISKYVVLKV